MNPETSESKTRRYKYGDPHPSIPLRNFISYRNKRGKEVEEWGSPETFTNRKEHARRIMEKKRREKGIMPIVKQLPEEKEAWRKEYSRKRTESGKCAEYQRLAKARETPEEKSARQAARRARYAADPQFRAKLKASVRAFVASVKECPEAWAARTAKYREYQRKVANPKKASRIKADPVFRLRVWAVNQHQRYIENFGNPKGRRSLKILGCSPDILKQHLEAKFTEGMSWENYGKWHIDHIVPLASATKEKQVLVLCHYRNLQPLWASDNMRKGDQIPA